MKPLSFLCVEEQNKTIMLDIKQVIKASEATIKEDFAILLHQVEVLEMYPDDTSSKDRIKAITNKYSK